MPCVIAPRNSKMAHHRFLARTVVVENGVASALRSLQRVLTQENVIKDVRLKRYYEKPTVKRRRVKYENALKLYNSEMKRKVDFIMAKQRKETPWTWESLQKQVYVTTTGDKHWTEQCLFSLQMVPGLWTSKWWIMMSCDSLFRHLTCLASQFDWNSCIMWYPACNSGKSYGLQTEQSTATACSDKCKCRLNVMDSNRSKLMFEWLPPPPLVFSWCYNMLKLDFKNMYYKFYSCYNTFIVCFWINK